MRIDITGRCDRVHEGNVSNGFRNGCSEQRIGTDEADGQRIWKQMKQISSGWGNALRVDGCEFYSRSHLVAMP